MPGRLVRVGVREFREELTEYLDSSTPVAITRHGQTVGYYIPARGKVDEQEALALKRAVGKLNALLSEHGVSEDEVVREFRAGRRSR
jgi:PHD/YefM family antitoxin component YafN of YafNO toxin-antitoxin module